MSFEHAAAYINGTGMGIILASMGALDYTNDTAFANGILLGVILVFSGYVLYSLSI